MTTVAELIRILQHFPQDRPVHVGTHEEEFEDVNVYERSVDLEFRHLDACVCIEGDVPR